MCAWQMTFKLTTTATTADSKNTSRTSERLSLEQELDSLYHASDPENCNCTTPFDTGTLFPCSVVAASDLYQEVKTNRST